MNYIKFIQERLHIVGKDGIETPFVLNAVQEKYLEESTGRDIILKARQQGFSSLILAMFTADFLLKENSRSVIVADISDNATELLDRVKRYIQSYEHITGVKVPLKYNSKYELYNEALNSRYTIGTADNSDFGRSKTITNLHLSEAAFYHNFTKILASAGSAVVPDGKFIIETTANGFNEFKTFWDNSTLDETGFKPLFYKASDFYSEEHLNNERKRLGRLFDQEYPESAEIAFISSGELFFDNDALKAHLMNVKEVMVQELIY